MRYECQKVWILAEYEMNEKMLVKTLQVHRTLKGAKKAQRGLMNRYCTYIFEFEVLA